MFPQIAYAQSTQWFDSFVQQGLTVLNSVVPVIIGIGLLAFMFNGAMMIVRSDNEQRREEGRKQLLWGVVALFVMVSVWGLVQLFQSFTGVSPGAKFELPKATMGS